MLSGFQQSEKELLQQLAEGSKVAFETIYNQHYITVFHLAKRFVTDIHAAEDIVTEAFMKIWGKQHSFDSLQSIKFFLYSVTKNACLNHLRAKKKQSANHKELSYLLTIELEEEKQQHEITARIYQYIFDEIEQMPAQLKTVFKMAYIDDMSNEDIARQLSINNQSVRNHKSRAVKYLRIAMLDKNIFESLLLCLLFKWI